MRYPPTRALLLLAAALACADSSGPDPQEPGTAYDLVYEGYPSGTPELMRLDPAEGAPARLLAPGTLAMDPAPSADGTKVAFVATDDEGNGDIYVANRDGSGLRRLTTDPEVDDQPAWSPDGTKLVFRSSRALRAGDLWVMNADGSSQVNLTPREGTAVIDHARPAWSPDGTRIAYTSNEGGDAGIWTMSPTGGDRRQLTNTIDFDTEPTWSPDGQRIAFRRSDPERGSDILIVSAAGGEPTRLAIEGEQRMPAWSPDGARIAFVGQPGLTGRPVMYTMRPDGSDVHAHTSDPALGPALNPAWLRRP